MEKPIKTEYKDGVSIITFKNGYYYTSFTILSENMINYVTQYHNDKLKEKKVKMFQKIRVIALSALWLFAIIGQFADKNYFGLFCAILYFITYLIIEWKLNK